MSTGRDARPRLMGILNVTPDSFSDGGAFYEADAALRHASEMAAAGVDILDIGGESTRPGAGRIDAAEQLKRVLPVIEAIHAGLPEMPLSIDTTQSEVAKAALAAGATMINDISAGRDDPRIFDLAADSGAWLVLMHMQGEPATMQENPRYADVVGEVREFLCERASAAEAAGVAADRIVIDPGIGFGKSRQHNLDLIASLPRFVETGYAVMLGASRKRFMGSLCRVEQYDELVGATCATTVLAVQAGVRFVRVHDVQQNRQALDVAWALGRGE